MTKFIEKVAVFLNRIDGTWLNFLAISSVFLGIRLIYNEEQYLGYAKQFMDPNWIPASFSMSDFAGSRIVFQFIAGSLLKWMNIESLAFFGRALVFLLMAYLLKQVFRYFNISNLAGLFYLLIIFIPHQSLFAGEWMIGGLEGKSIAYLFILSGLLSLFRGKYALGLFFAVLATYFHILAGGWFTLVFLIFRLVSEKTVFKQMLAGVIYLTATMPLLVYFYLGLTEGKAETGSINLDEIYVYYRNPHHIGLFQSAEYFFQRHLGGVLLSLFSFLLCIFVFSSFTDRNIKVLNTLNIILFSQQFIFLALALFPFALPLLKLYPWRTSSLSALLTGLELILIFKSYIYPFILKKINPEKLNLKMLIRGGMIVCILFMISLNLYQLISKNTTYYRGELRQETIELARLLNKRLSSNDCFILLNEGSEGSSLMRHSERDCFVLHRFVPTTEKQMMEWYERLQLRDTISQNPELVLLYQQKYSITCLISSEAVDHPRFELCFSGKYYYAYFLKP